MKAEPVIELEQSPLISLALAPDQAGAPGTLWRVTTPDASTRLSVDDLKKYQAHLTNPATVVVFEEAKPLLRNLLRQGIDVARPVCLKTLTQISFSSAADENNKNNNIFKRLSELLQATEDIQCKALARLECLVLRSFASMEEKGLHINAPKWSQIIKEKQEEAASAAKDCEVILAPLTQKDLFGNAVINLSHPEEMRLLFEMALGRPVSGIGNELLESLDHPLPRAFLKYREASKLVSTYGERFLEYVNPKTQRIHADFILLGASTGRVSCHKPNLQNLPSGRQFEECLGAPPGRALIGADFSACELRILAGLAGDPNFLSAINSDNDFHSVVATQLFDKKVSKTENPELRHRAKAINFGIIYGMGAKGLARSLNLSEYEAQNILSRYFSRFPLVKEYLEGCVTTAKRLGYARTLLGRRLYFENSASAEFDISRIAKNMPIQGTAAELAKLAMTRVHERLVCDFKDAFLVNMIHDELVVECKEADKEAVGIAVKQEMLGAQETLFANVRPDVELSFR